MVHKEGVEDWSGENEENKKLVETASRAMGNTRHMAVAEEATPLEVGGMKYLNPERQKRVKELQKLLKELRESEANTPQELLRGRKGFVGSSITRRPPPPN